MSFEWFVARRYLTARRKQAFISLISGVSILGVGVGVMALVIATAIMTGVQTDLRDRIVGTTAHIYVYRTDGRGFNDVNAKIGPVPGEVGIAPAILDNGLAHAGSINSAIFLKGIDVKREPSVTDIERLMKSG